MKYLRTFEGHDLHFWDDLGIGGRGYSTKPSKEEQKEIKKRKVIYGVNNLSDCKECGARSIYPKKHNCDGEDEGTGYLGYSSDKDAIVLGEDEDLPLESMKYLRTFNESTDPGQDQWVSNQNYIQLLLVGRPMGDEGYDKVKYSEILPTINRIESFLKSEGYEMDDITVSSINGTGWDHITLKELNDYVEDGKLDISWHQQRFLFNKVK